MPAADPSTDKTKDPITEITEAMEHGHPEGLMDILAPWIASGEAQAALTSSKAIEAALQEAKNEILGVRDRFNLDILHTLMDKVRGFLEGLREDTEFHGRVGARAWRLLQDEGANYSPLAQLSSDVEGLVDINQAMRSVRTAAPDFVKNSLVDRAIEFLNWPLLYSQLNLRWGAPIDEQRRKEGKITWSWDAREKRNDKLRDLVKATRQYEASADILGDQRLADSVKERMTLMMNNPEVFLPDMAALAHIFKGYPLIEAAIDGVPGLTKLLEENIIAEHIDLASTGFDDTGVYLLKREGAEPSIFADRQDSDNIIAAFAGCFVYFHTRPTSPGDHSMLMARRIISATVKAHDKGWPVDVALSQIAEMISHASDPKHKHHSSHAQLVALLPPERREMAARPPVPAAPRA